MKCPKCQHNMDSIFNKGIRICPECNYTVKIGSKEDLKLNMFDDEEPKDKTKFSSYVIAVLTGVLFPSIGYKLYGSTGWWLGGFCVFLMMIWPWLSKHMRWA